MHIEYVLALGLLATSIACGWLLYRVRTQGPKPTLLESHAPDPAATMADVRRAMQAATASAVDAAAQAAATVQKGVR